MSRFQDLCQEDYKSSLVFYNLTELPETITMVDDDQERENDTIGDDQNHQDEEDKDEDDEDIETAEKITTLSQIIPQLDITDNERLLELVLVLSAMMEETNEPVYLLALENGLFHKFAVLLRRQLANPPAPTQNQITNHIALCIGSIAAADDDLAKRIAETGAFDSLLAIFTQLIDDDPSTDPQYLLRHTIVWTVACFIDWNFALRDWALDRGFLINTVSSNRPSPHHPPLSSRLGQRHQGPLYPQQTRIQSQFLPQSQVHLGGPSDIRINDAISR